MLDDEPLSFPRPCLMSPPCRFIIRFHQRLREDVLCLSETGAPGETVKHHERNQPSAQQTAHNPVRADGAELVSNGQRRFLLFVVMVEVTQRLGQNKGANGVSGSLFETRFPRPGEGDDVPAAGSVYGHAVARLAQLNSFQHGDSQLWTFPQFLLRGSRDLVFRSCCSFPFVTIELGPKNTLRTYWKITSCRTHSTVCHELYNKSVCAWLYLFMFFFFFFSGTSRVWWKSLNS